MKHVLITGGSDGLGKAAAKKLAAADYSITILAPNKTKTKAVAKSLNCKFVIADITDYAQVEAAFQQATEQSGAIDILINCAGVWLQGALENNEPVRIQRTLETNTLGTIFCTRAVIPEMKKRRRGRIINVISGAGFSAKAERAPYSASKWAITGFTKCMQAELKQHHIAVEAFYPGAMDTTMFEKAGNAGGRDMSKSLDPGIAADALSLLCGLPSRVSVPEFSILSLDYESSLGLRVSRTVQCRVNMDVIVQPIRSAIRGFTDKVAVQLNRFSNGKVSPDAVTLVGLVMHIPIAILIVIQQNVLAAILLIVFGLFDTLDGALARAQNHSFARGVLLDSSTDRMKEVLLYTAIAYSIIEYSGHPLQAVWVVTACGCSLLTSYVNAWGDAVMARFQVQNHVSNTSLRGGLMPFEVRVFVIVVGLLTDHLFVAILLITLGAAYTVFERMYRIFNKLRESNV